jgi:DNA-binding NtrC family response regulator
MVDVLIVDDEPGFTSGIADFLSLRDHQVRTADTLETARRSVVKQTPDVLVLDLMLPDGSGLELLDAFTDKRPQRIIIISGHTGVRSLIGGIAGDGVTFMKKPVEPLELLGLLNTVTDSSADGEEGDRHFGVLIGDSDAMQAVYEQIRQVAPTDSTVFLQGESGTGKELVADAVHRLSGRTGTFVPVNCGGLSPDLVSSQLFGHEKGSFSGATRRHVGFFERANGGTLFLDEITEMPLEMQSHLLRVLESGRVLRVGSEAEIRIDVRLVAATNRDPVKSVRDGTLRQDLYFRLCQFPIRLPPLRERHDDMSLLAQYFLDELNSKHGTGKAFADEALEQLERHGWPGNVRELKHVVHRAYIIANGDVLGCPDRFDEELPGDIEGLRAGRSIADVEKDLILATLDHFGGDKKEAAASLGVSLKTLYNRLKAYEEQNGR